MILEVIVIEILNVIEIIVYGYAFTLLTFKPYIDSIMDEAE